MEAPLNPDSDFQHRLPSPDQGNIENKEKPNFLFLNHIFSKRRGHGQNFKFVCTSCLYDKKHEIERDAQKPKPCQTQKIVQRQNQ